MHGVANTIFEINELKNLNNGVITLGITPIAGMDPIPQILEQFRVKYPHIQVTFIEKDVGEIEELLIEDKIDLAFIITGNNNNLIEYTSLASQELVVCCSKQHSFHKKNSVELSELVSEPLILLAQHCLLRTLIVKEFEKINTLPQIVFESTHIQTIKSLVACNAGLTLLPQSLCDNSLINIPLSTPITVDIALAVKKNKHQSHATQALITLARKSHF